MASKYEFNMAAREEFYRYPECWRLDAFRIYGNLYYVGNKSVGSYLIDTEDGLLLIDTTYPTTTALLVDSIWSLGFNPRDIRAIVHTHGHFDHIGGTALLKHMSGAKTYLGEGDANMFRERPELILAECMKYSYVEPFIPDVILTDGALITLGSTTIKAVATPGHSEGVFSFFFDVEENGTMLRAGLQGGAGLNTLCRPFIERFQNEDWRVMFLNSLQKIYKEPVDINLGNHAGHNHTVEKRKQMIETPNAPNPFIDSDEWRDYLDRVRLRYDTMILEEAQGRDML